MSIAIDDTSLLVSATGDTTLAAIETELSGVGLTLGLHAPETTTVASWIASGTPGAQSVFADPADHVVAGFEATLVNDDKLVVRPSPRRAVGPDLAALLIGAGDRFGRIDRAWLRVHRKEARRVALPLPEGVDLDPPVSDAESALLSSIMREMSKKS
jgi:alkyldihydroxyacetonephosphate synthase